MADNSLNLLICAGGTGGGVYPALAVLQALQNKTSGEHPILDSVSTAYTRPDETDLRVNWVGGIGGMEAKLVEPTGVKYFEIPAAGLHGVGIRKLPGNLMHVLRGVISARAMLRDLSPNVLFFTGGYVAIPVALAGALFSGFGRRPRSLLYIPDIEPGLALKVLARFADHIAITDKCTASFLPSTKSVTETGYPVRKELVDWASDPDRKAKACQIFGLNPAIPVLLVFGGSKGARSINRALLQYLPNLLNEIQIIHITGQLDWPEIEEARNRLNQEFPQVSSYYHAYPYLHQDMAPALAVADLVLSRAGASCLGEFPLFGLPSILIPYPHAWRYQLVNAKHLVEKGAAIMIKDSDLSTELQHQILSLLHTPEVLLKMKQSMLKLANPNAARTIAALAKSLVHVSGGGPQ